MTAIIDLTPMILPFVRDCSAPAAVVAARFAAIEFYKQTLWQQEALEPILLQAGRSIYEIETPPDTVPSLVSVVAAFRDRMPNTPPWISAALPVLSIDAPARATRTPMLPVPMMLPLFDTVPPSDILAPKVVAVMVPPLNTAPPPTSPKPTPA